MDALVKDLEAKLETARAGGGQKAAERMRTKGKKLPRERCADPATDYSSICRPDTIYNIRVI